MVLEPARTLYKKYERWVPIAFFLLGFGFDTLMLHRIDEPAVIVQQALYILISAAFIGVELVEKLREVHPPLLLKWMWKYREGLLHFFLGTLLNSYTIFYFKSASALTSFVFIAILIALLMLNEFQHFGESQTKVHVALLGLCVISYLVSLAPIVLGYLGTVPFLAAVAVSAVFVAAYYQILKRKLTEKPRLLTTHVLLPFLAIQAVFVAMYFARLIPPVPLSVKYLGIYHEVKKAKGEYELFYTRSKWRFWQHGDQTFSARPGDSIYCFAQVFSPARFKDQLKVRWAYYDTRQGEWHSSDAIPMPIVGGREEGYRGVTKKSNFAPGDWRVSIETLDGREIGSIGLTVEKDETTEERDLKMQLL